MPRFAVRRFGLRKLVAFTVGLGMALGVSGSGAEPKKVIMPQFAFPEPFPALLAAGGKSGVAVDTKERPPTLRAAQPGDALTFLVALRDGERMKQWLLQVETVELTEQELQLPPLKGMRRFTSTGAEINLGGTRAAIEITLIGPLARRDAERSSAAPEMKRRRLLVNADYLGAGFDAASESMALITAQNRKREMSPEFQPKWATKPFSAEAVQANRLLAEEIGITAEQERAYLVSGPALMEFVNLIIKTPGLQDVMKEVVDVSWWSILSRGGEARQHIQIITDMAAKLPDRGPGERGPYVYPFVLLVNDKPAMTSVLFVTKPMAPLATTGGVIGIQAGRPFDESPQLTVRLLAMKCRDAISAPRSVKE